MIVVVEAVVKARAVFFQTWKARSVGKEDIEIAIVVIVQQGDPAGDAVNHGFIGSGAVVQD